MGAEQEKKNKKRSQSNQNTGSHKQSNTASAGGASGKAKDSSVIRSQDTEAKPPKIENGKDSHPGVGQE